MNLLSNLEFFTVLAKSKSIGEAAKALDLTPSAASKKLAILEEYYGARLIERTAKHLSLTNAGEILLDGANNAISHTNFIRQSINENIHKMQGSISVSAPFGIGRYVIADLVRAFCSEHPGIQIKLHLTDSLIRLPDDSIDVAIKVGVPPDSRLIAHKLASNEHTICASPDYLQKHGEPNTLQELKQHQIIGLRQYEEPANLWRFLDGVESISLRVPLSLETNDGDVAVRWALDGLGIIRRAHWHVSQLIQSNQLVPILTNLQSSPSDIYALHTIETRKVKRASLFLDFLKRNFAISMSAQGAGK